MASEMTASGMTASEMRTVQSYVQGEWRDGEGEPRLLVNPTTEAPIAECRSLAGSLGALLDHARDVGGPALRALDFRARGELLGALAGALHEVREELIDASIENGGSTRSDAKFDVDGATGTLAAYAGFAKTLPAGAASLADGAGIQLGRTPRFWGQHVLVPRLGAAVHVNAFNFPAWGMCEKMACALLAGVPVIEKPGTPTALVAYRAARTIVESGVLPEGTFQFIAGSTGDLLDRLGPQDAFAFTGSAQTGAKLRGGKTLVERSVRVNIEADSLNAAILAPDVEPSSETYGQFLANVALDVRQKTGQKCTAVRRILVPSARGEDVVRDLCEELGRIQVGDPADKDTTMGPVASADQLRDVRAGIDRLAEQSEVACGGSERAAEKGFFVRPTLLVAAHAETDVFHELEVFGPVATVILYDGSAEEAARLANRGGGSLVGSVYSDDKRWTETCVRAMAPWHGRIWIGSERVAGQASAPGLVLPMTTHGGPGRAGGGEELGGLRGLAFYMQRTAIQGFQGLVAKAFGAPEA